MSLLPIVPHHRPKVSSARIARALEVVPELESGLQTDRRFDRLRTRSLEPGGSLVLEDFTEVYFENLHEEVWFLEHRARLRAGDDDLVAAHRPCSPAWESYCQTRLGLGAPRWLVPELQTPPVRLAAGCWVDRATRSELVRALREGRLRYLHPYHGSLATWRLAWLLQRAARRPLAVLAPPPTLARLANDKVWFAELVRRVLGESHLPRSLEAKNLSTLTAVVRSLARSSRRVVIKRPDAAGGSGNLVLDARSLRDRPLGDLRQELRRRMAEVRWDGHQHLLVSAWETEVLGSPSVQLWIPPDGEGQPAIEALYEQVLEGPEGTWVGSQPVRLAEALRQRIVDQSFLLARVLQALGWVGRCSFDLLLVGNEIERVRPEFIECNGRWGGTSIPMTLLNRLLGDAGSRPHYIRELFVPGLEGVATREILAGLEGSLFDAGTGEGELIVFNPGRRAFRPAIGVIGLGDSNGEARRRIDVDLAARLAEMATGNDGRPDRLSALPCPSRA